MLAIAAYCDQCQVSQGEVAIHVRDTTIDVHVALKEPGVVAGVSVWRSADGRANGAIACTRGLA